MCVVIVIKPAYFVKMLVRMRFSVVETTSASTNESGDTTPCRMTGVTLHSHVRQNEDLWVVRVGRDDGDLRPWHDINVYSQSGVITTLRIYPWHPSISEGCHRLISEVCHR